MILIPEDGEEEVVKFLMAIAKALVLGLDIVGELVVWVECSVCVGAIKHAKGAVAG